MNNYEVIFESERILFIKLNEDLVNDYLIMINDSNIQKFISHNPKTYTYEQELDWVRKNLKSDELCFSMIEKDTKEFIGNVGLTKKEGNIGELGISITANKQNKHYGYEAINRIVDYGYSELKLDRIELNVFENNSRAVHCYENVGFVKDGIGKEKNDIHMIYSKRK